MAELTRLSLGDATFELRLGGRLVDLADEHDLDLPFGCRSASCGTCRVELLRGAQAFEPANDEEQETLEAFDARSDVRLGCQLRLAHAVEEVELRAVED